MTLKLLSAISHHAIWLIALVTSLSAHLPSATAQSPCDPQWLPGHGVIGFNEGGLFSPVMATTLWDPDGAGPLDPVLVAAGYFFTADGASASNIARWNGSAWLPFAGPICSINGGPIFSLATLPNGDLVAGGLFTSFLCFPANYIARWNGTEWLPLAGPGGNGMNRPVYSLAVLPNGDLVAGGDFSIAGGVAANCIARWNGSQWLPFTTPGGNGMNGTVHSLMVLPNGDIVAGGTFTTAGGVAANGVARWNGTGWQPFATAAGNGVNGPVYSLTILPSGDIVAGGGFSTACGVQARGIARWNGTEWLPLAGPEGIGINGYVYSLTVLPDGDLVAGGFFTTAGDVAANYIARWNGSNWFPFITAGGNGVDSQVATLMVLPEGDLVAGGGFTTAGGVVVNHLARWNGTDWRPITSQTGNGMSNDVRSLKALPNGDLVAGGWFSTAGGVTVHGIARWSGTEWLPFAGSHGNGLNGGSVDSFALLPNGDLVAGGSFPTMGGVTVNGIARWNGTDWFPFISGSTIGVSGGTVRSLEILPNGDLVAAGDFTTAGGIAANRIARWNGDAWLPFTALGGNGMNNTVNCLAVMPNGDLVAGGDFTTSGGVEVNRIARWNGTAWTPFTSAGGNGIGGTVFSLAVLPNGNLVAGGSFNSAGGVSVNAIACWNGIEWLPVASSGLDGTVYALAALPNGDLIAGGAFISTLGASSITVNLIARSNGTEWFPLAGPGAAGIDYARFADVHAVAVLPDGDIYVGGHFESAGGVVSTNIARYSFGNFAPNLTLQPVDITACSTGTASFTVAASNTAPLSYQWQLETAPNSWINAINGILPYNGGVSGIITARNVTTDHLQLALSTIPGAPALRFRCIITNVCDSVTSDPATLTMCQADFNCDDTVDFFDYLDFVQEFSNATTSADFNDDGIIDIFDYLDFVQSFRSGC